MLIYISVLFSGFNNTSCVIEGLDSYWIYLLTVEAIVENFAPNKSTDYDGVRTAQSGNLVSSHDLQK